ncbi:hypothetical protein RHGRI_012230 [Rhododendron griersonianum]|uniref:Uncharacterized protein n=1 Tax=Rhododendron griersonianum TaxID=479676 RepID=A0AAV6KPM7_9ERIC|nr:hypothetical protein RHGRI_012230 [Rhododendron griersonianum]
MPFPMKIQPLDPQFYRESIRNDASAATAAKPVLKSRLKKLFDGVLKTSSAAADKTPAACDHGNDGAVATEFEPSSVCLAKMVQNFIEESNEKQSAVKCGRNRCNCFNGNSNDSSDDEFDVSSCFGDSVTAPSSGDSLDMLKDLIPCASVAERNLLADTSKIVEKNKACKRKDDLRKIVTDGLLLLGHDASICKSRWEKSPSFPAGEYEYIDVIGEGGERVLIDIDFRSEFEIARSTGGYKSILQSLPHVFVGGSDRLHQIISVVSEAARQSLRKKGMHIPPWRKAEYMRSKWLSPHARTASVAPPNDAVVEVKTFTVACDCGCVDCECGDLELIFSEKTSSWEEIGAAGSATASAVENSGKDKKYTWQPPAIERKCCEKRGTRVVTGLASLLGERE